LDKTKVTDKEQEVNA